MVPVKDPLVGYIPTAREIELAAQMGIGPPSPMGPLRAPEPEAELQEKEKPQQAEQPPQDPDEHDATVFEGSDNIPSALTPDGAE